MKITPISSIKNFTFFLLLTLINSERKLIFVYEHARHGARGPSSGYNAILNDGVDEYRIDWGTDGELSAIGKIQHYYLGIRNRLKYSSLIDFNHYDPREILVHATDYNRTHQSISSELMAMYKDAKEEKLTDEEKKDWYFVNKDNIGQNESEIKSKIEEEIESLNGQVNPNSMLLINVHPFPKNRIFLVDNCKEIKVYRDEKCGNEVRALYKEFDEKYGNQCQKFFKLENKNYFTNYNKMKSITDHFICDYDNKKDLSAFHDETGIDLKEFYEFSKRFYGKFIFDWFIDEYTSGLEETHLMSDVLGYMDSRIKNKDKTTYKAPKMVLDAGHDTTVGPISRFMSSAFNIKYNTFCNFACNVYFELYEDNGDYFVDYFLDDEKLIDNMKYDEFKKKIQSKFWTDEQIENFCKNEDTKFNYKTDLEGNATLYMGISIISTSLFLVFGVSTIVIFRRLKKLEKKFNENPLLNNDLQGNELPDLS